MDETTVRQLIKDMGTDCSELTQIRSKDGVSVYRVKSGNGRYVLKAFDNAQYCREIFDIAWAQGAHNRRYRLYRQRAAVGGP